MQAYAKSTNNKKLHKEAKAVENILLHAPTKIKKALASLCKDQVATSGDKGDNAVLSSEDTAAVVAELKTLCNGKNIVVLRDLIVEPSSQRNPTVDTLSHAHLRLLGDEAQLHQAKNIRSKIPEMFLVKLKWCFKTAFPNWEILVQDKSGRVVHGVKFKGLYAVPPVAATRVSATSSSGAATSWLASGP